MADLAKKLEKEGYDLLDGTLRDHRVLQIWRKRFTNPIERLASSVHRIFKSDMQIGTQTATALNVVSNASQDLKFQIGLTALENTLSKNNLGNLELGTKITSGKSVEISYSDAYSETVEQIDLEAFFHDADFNYQDPTLLTDLNRDNLVIITGVVYAKNFKATIESKNTIDVNLDAEIKGVTKGKIGVTRESDTKIVLSAPLEELFPIAIKCHKIKFKDSSFQKLVLVSDSKDWF